MTSGSWWRAGVIAVVGAACALTIAGTAKVAVHGEPAGDTFTTHEPLAATPSGPPDRRASAATPLKHSAIPILMYHVIGDPRPGAPNTELYVSYEDFSAQVRWLDSNGYSAVRLDDIWENWHGRRALPTKPIVITFDDGSRSIVERASPVLTERGWPGVLNLDLSNMNAAEGFSERRIARLVAAGWEVASHTLTHPDLTTLDDVELRREVAGSRAEIQRRFGVIADFFCYPSGQFDERVIAAVKTAGYLGATTTIDGLARASEPYRLARVRVNRSDRIAGFAATMRALREPR